MRNLEHTKISYRDVLECKNELESIRAKLTDAKDVVETIESTIKEAWKGPSATSFYDKLSNLKTDMTNESDSLTSLTLSMEESINSYQNVDMEIIKSKPSSNITSDNNITSNNTGNQGSNGTINNNRNNTNNGSNNNSNNDSSNNTNNNQEYEEAIIDDDGTIIIHIGNNDSITSKKPELKEGNNQEYEEAIIDDDGTIIIHIGSNDSITSKKPELKEGETVIQCGSAITRIIKNLHNDGSISDDVYNKYMTNVKGMYAKDYWTNNQNSNAFATSTEPKVGSIAVYNNGQYGHTALVTDVYYDKNGTGYVTVYESNIENKNPEGGLSTMTIEEFKTRLGGKYQGCIDLMGNN